jgi:MoaA/NifB/PqqE/SkfB family radical SAM enzyme
MKKLVFNNHLNLDFLSRVTKWHLNFYILRRGTPLNAGVLITNGCNCRCIMCDVWKTKKPSIYPREAQFKAIDALGRMGCYYYSVSGGETTLVKDLPDRLAYAARKIPYVHVVTNGLTMNPELARALGSSGITEISLSLDGSERIHNLLRGRPDAFKKAWRALDLIYTHAPKLQVVVNSVLTPYNLEGLRELGKQLDSFPNVCQKYLPLTFHGIFRTQERRSIIIQEEEASSAMMEDFLMKALKDTRNVNSPIFLKKAIRYFKGEQNLLSEQRSCLYPYHAIDFDAFGTAYPCMTGMDFKGGLPADSDLSEYLQSDAYRRRQEKLRNCQKCVGNFMLCYYEPRLNFPLHNLLWGMTWGKWKGY